ncbi:hypothetical protein [Bartonella sp. LJL80]
MIRTYPISAFVSVVALMVSTFVSAGEIQANGPSGRYCGFVYHAGYEVRSEVTITPTADGRIIGKMIYRDAENVTDGTIEELAKGQGTERTIQWKDKYGTGLAILKFDDKFDHFEGRWGSSLQLLQFPWTGKRCNDFTS